MSDGLITIKAIQGMLHEAQRRQFVIYEETGEEREVVGYCRVCKATPDEDVMLVSPQGLAHHATMDTTDCGHNATGDGWWWRL